MSFHYRAHIHILLLLLPLLHFPFLFHHVSLLFFLLSLNFKHRISFSRKIIFSFYFCNNLFILCKEAVSAALLQSCGFFFLLFVIKSGHEWLGKRMSGERELEKESDDRQERTMGV